MPIKEIHTETDYNSALEQIEKLWGGSLETPEGNELNILATLIDKYEEKHFLIEVVNVVKRKPKK